LRAATTIETNGSADPVTDIPFSVREPGPPSVRGSLAAIDPPLVAHRTA
jgi:hypothetical protein